MHVDCKSCGSRIPVAYKPKGSTSLTGVRAAGNVGVGDGEMTFGPGGGSISFRPGGQVGFRRPPASTFVCPECGKSHDYEASEIKDD